MSDAVLNYLYTLFLSILSTFHRRDYLWASVAKVMEGRLPWTNWPWFLPWIMAVTSDSIWFELQLPFLSPFPLTNRHSLSTQQPQIRSDQISRSVTSDSLWPHESQHAKPPSLSPTPGVHWDSRPSSQWCHPAISSSVVPFSSCPQSLPASECFPMSQLFAWGGQSIGVQLQHHSFQRNPRADLQNGLVGSPCSPRDSQESSPTPQFKSINSSALSLFHSPTLTSIRDHRKNHSLD